MAILKPELSRSPCPQPQFSATAAPQRMIARNFGFFRNRLLEAFCPVGEIHSACQSSAIDQTDNFY